MHDRTGGLSIYNKAKTNNDDNDDDNNKNTNNKMKSK